MTQITIQIYMKINTTIQYIYYVVVTIYYILLYTYIPALGFLPVVFCCMYSFTTHCIFMNKASKCNTESYKTIIIPDMG